MKAAFHAGSTVRKTAFGFSNSILKKLNLTLYIYIIKLFLSIVLKFRAEVQYATIKTVKIKKRHIFEILFVVLVIALAVWLGPMVDTNEFFQKAAMKYGYLGTFIISIISGFNLIIPIPAIAFLPILVAAGLNKWILILIISIGMTTADSASYFIGKVGRKFTDEKILARIEKLNKLYEKHHWLPLTILLGWASFAPLPNEILIIPLSFLGFRLKFILPIVFFGNLVFNSAAALGLVTISGII